MQQPNSRDHKQDTLDKESGQDQGGKKRKEGEVEKFFKNNESNTKVTNRYKNKLNAKYIYIFNKTNYIKGIQ